MTTILHCRQLLNAVLTGLEPSAADWITTEIEVRIRESHGDDDFINQTGVIRNISVRYSCVVTEN